MNELALFAGAGGGILGGKLLGWRTVCAVEVAAGARQSLLDRQRDGLLERFPIWDDVRTFDGRPWKGIIDIVSGGFPCQDISVAGSGKGIDGERSGLWTEMARIIGEVRPLYAFVENSSALTSRGLGRVLGDLAEMGYHARWGVLGAADAIWYLGNPAVDHERARIWIVATRTDSDGVRELESQRSIKAQRGWVGDMGKETADTDCTRCEKLDIPAIAKGSGQSDRLHHPICNTNGIDRRAGARRENGAETGDANWWSTEPGLGRVAHGVARRMDRLRAIGNGQVPAVAALAWLTLAGGADMINQPKLQKGQNSQTKKQP
jgi:DNA (cytosine-5)-methyltransferase 1